MDQRSMDARTAPRRMSRPRRAVMPYTCEGIDRLVTRTHDAHENMTSGQGRPSLLASALDHK
jgi:hypothetical protein